MTPLTLLEEDLFLSGHNACPGCSVAQAIRFALQALGPKSVLVIPPSCIASIAGNYPTSSMNLPVFQTAFETTAAAASGLSRAYRALGQGEVTVACLAGDGGTHDIGFQALSGAAERNEEILYLCFDNEGYQNTGNQKSSATPWGAKTTSTPHGKGTRKKSLVEIMAVQRIPYAATATPGFPDDLVSKVKKAKGIRGTRFIEILCPCIPGWGVGDDASIRVARLAVESKLFPLYEVEDGERYTITRMPKGLPVTEYLGIQRRFAHLTEAEIQWIQEDVDRAWERLARKASVPVEV